MVKSIKGVDVRQQGSGNTGATNVFRIAGKGPGFATLGIDVLKGLAPVLISIKLFPGQIYFHAAVGLATILGHTLTPFLGFKGGKGVATSLGVYSALVPLPSLITVICFAIAFAFTRIVSISSLVAAVGMSVSTILFSHSKFHSWLVCGTAVLIFILHRKNIQRLIKGEEPKII
jgi:acyl phosphate:glycerol-3-phosphate acyltransferase